MALQYENGESVENCQWQNMSTKHKLEIDVDLYQMVSQIASTRLSGD